MFSKIIYSFVAAGLCYLAVNAIGAPTVSTLHATASSMAVANVNTRRLEQPAITKGLPEKVIAHTGFVLSFNKNTLCPNWVAWELTANEAQYTGERLKKFLPDMELPVNQQVEHEDYTNSGFDRGHMCPAADMHWNAQAQRDCFLMSNICPQARRLNSGAWKKLEEACRRWAMRDGSVYIACGPIFRKGATPSFIGRNVRVRVPDAFFKVVLCTKAGKEKAIGFVYDNIDEKQNMAHQAMSVDEVEKITGMDFFPLLNDKLEQQLEAKCNFSAWQ